jgi:hypothetical protein
MQTPRFRKRWFKTAAKPNPLLHSWITFENKTRREEEPYLLCFSCLYFSHTLQTIVDGGSSTLRVCVDLGSTCDPSPSRPKLHGGVMDVPLKIMCLTSQQDPTHPPLTIAVASHKGGKYPTHIRYVSRQTDKTEQSPHESVQDEGRQACWIVPLCL